MSGNHTIIEYENGIRLVHLQVSQSEIVHCGFMINVGSRDETTLNNGVAHFIEHTVFKGTSSRRSHHILRRIENVGGELNAFTTREKTCYYASCLKQYADRAIELLTDITFHSIFPEKELAKEQKVIIEEIDMYEDSPEESVYDDFYALLFKGHPLGFNILGTKESVSSLGREDILRFIRENYQGENMVLSIVGDLSPVQAKRLGDRFLKDISLDRRDHHQRKPPQQLPCFREKVEKDFAQAHCILGSRAYSRNDERRFGLSLINNILGNSGMSARLNMAVREKHGLTYHIGTHYSAYQDAGVFTIYFATDPKNVQRCMDLVHRELKNMRENRFSENQLKQVKLQFLGQLAMLVENNSIAMQHQARSLLDYGEVHTFRDFMREVEKVTAEEIQQISREVLDTYKLCTLMYEVEKEN